MKVSRMTGIISLRFVKPGGVVYFHDCDATSPGVVQLFEEIGKGWKNKISGQRRWTSVRHLWHR
jgi:hypothetical protein